MLSLVAALFVADPVLAQNSGLIRLEQRDALFGWEAVGRVEIGGDGYCTGVLIATDLVLTAAHCVYDAATGAPRDAASLKFRAGWRDGAAIAERGVARVSAHADYDPNKGVSLQNLRSDAALLRLQSAIPAAIAAPFALHGPAESGQSVSVVSYGRGRDSALSWQRSCGLVGRQGGILAFDCDVTFGSSGAPVFVRDGRRARILTLVSSGGRRGARTLAYGMELPAVVADLKRQMRAGGPARPTTTRIKRIRFGERKSAGGARFIKP